MANSSRGLLVRKPCDYRLKPQPSGGQSSVAVDRLSGISVRTLNATNVPPNWRLCLCRISDRLGCSAGDGSAGVRRWNAHYVSKDLDQFVAAWLGAWIYL